MKLNTKSKSLQKIILNKNIRNSNNNRKEKTSLNNNIKNISLTKKISTKKENINCINILNNIIKSNNEQKLSEIIKKDKSIINKLISNGLALLHILVIKQNKKLIEILLKNEADVNIISLKNKRTPLHLAYIYQKNESNDIIDLLVKYGAKDDILDNNKKKPSEYNKYKEKKEKKNGGENKLKKIKIKKERKKEGYKGNIYNLKDSNDNTFVIITMDNISYLTSDENTINQISDLTITKNSIINNNNEALNDSLEEININNSLYDSLEMKNNIEIKENVNNRIINDINIINTSENMDSFFTTLITNKRNSYINSGKIRTSFKTEEERNTILSHNEYTENSTFKIINNEKKINKKISTYNSAMSTLSQTNKKNNNDEIINYNEINQNCSFLLKWLIDIGLSDYYENFLNNKIYDINRLIEQMKSPNDKLGLEDIENILGIHNPGHIFKILIKLEIDANIINKNISDFMLSNNNNINKKLIFSSNEMYACDNMCNVKKENLNICGITNINIFSKLKNDLESFLNRYNLNNLYQNFYHNGFEQINYVILQMYSSYPINDDILENYFHIYDEEQRKLVIEALQKEISKVNDFINSEKYLYNKNKDLIKYENVDFYKDDNNNKSNDGCNIF